MAALFILAPPALPAEGIDASGLGPLTENTFNQVSTLAQVGVFFLGLIPALLGLAICIVPLQVGASTIAFPRAAAASFGHRLMMDVIVPGGVARDTGAIDATATRACGGIQRVATNRWIRRRG